jgi:hypothetical protein
LVFSSDIVRSNQKSQSFLNDLTEIHTA